MKHLILFLFIISFHQNAWGWGIKGHKVVAQIAEINLSSVSKAEIRKLLYGQSLAQVSIWADIIKFVPLYSHTKAWHYVSIPDGQEYSTIRPSKDGDVVSALGKMIKTLRDSKASDHDKRKALVFLVHFVGDIHQPLHVGRPDDRGGNDFIILFEGKKIDLHTLWDSKLLSLSRLNHVQYAFYLENNYSTDAQSLNPAFSIEQIIAECMDARSSIYDFKNSGTGSLEVDQEYLDRNLVLMNFQLLRGGKRLAFLLNSLFQ